MIFEDLYINQQVYVYRNDVNISENERCIECHVCEISPECVIVLSDDGMQYRFTEKTHMLTKDNSNPDISYKLLENKSEVEKYKNSMLMYNEIKEMLDLGFSKFESATSMDDISMMYNMLFPDHLDKIQWTAKNVGTYKECYRAHDREYAFLICYSIDKLNEKWFLNVGGNSNCSDTEHGYEYTMSSHEDSLENAMHRAEVFKRQMYNNFKSDLKNTIS